MVDRSRKMIRARAEDIDIVYDTLGSAFKTIQSLIERYGADAEIAPYQPEYSDCEYIGVFIQRLETDDEMNTRIIEEEKWEQYAADRDVKEFERLKKKFEKYEEYEKFEDY